MSKLTALEIVQGGAQTGLNVEEDDPDQVWQFVWSTLQCALEDEDTEATGEECEALYNSLIERAAEAGAEFRQFIIDFKEPRHVAA